VIIVIDIDQLPGYPLVLKVLLIWKLVLELFLFIQWGVKEEFILMKRVRDSTAYCSSSNVSHPTKQGLVQSFSVYIDTLLVCSATGLCC
jgi:AGCS family alanine or glycine:cation symporter